MKNFIVKVAITLGCVPIPQWLFKTFNFPSRLTSDKIKRCKYFFIISAFVSFLCLFIPFFFLGSYITTGVNNLFPKEKFGEWTRLSIFMGIYAGILTNIYNKKV